MKNFPQSIKLKSRDLQNNYLIQEKENIYKLKAELDDYVRCGLTDDQQGLYFIDPPGGPFIAVGDNIKNYTNDLLDNDLFVDKIDLNGNIYVR